MNFTATTVRADSILSEKRASAGKFEYKDVFYSGICVLSHDKSGRIKDCTLSAWHGFVGDIKRITKIVAADAKIIVHTAVIV